jgi:hypothetical protein
MLAHGGTHHSYRWIDIELYRSGDDKAAMHHAVTAARRTKRLAILERTND